MIWLSFERTIQAFSETLVARKNPPPSRVAALSDSVAQFLLLVHRSMPDYLRPPFRALVLLFDAWSLLFKGKPFHRLALRDRQRQVEAWRCSRFEIRRRFVEFYESLGMFGLYSELYGQDYKDVHLDRGSAHD